MVTLSQRRRARLVMDVIQRPIIPRTVLGVVSGETGSCHLLHFHPDFPLWEITRSVSNNLIN